MPDPRFPDYDADPNAESTDPEQRRLRREQLGDAAAIPDPGVAASMTPEALQRAARVRQAAIRSGQPEPWGAPAWRTQYDLKHPREERERMERQLLGFEPMPPGGINLDDAAPAEPPNLLLEAMRALRAKWSGGR